jgi:hypothetical protein
MTKADRAEAKRKAIETGELLERIERLEAASRT